MDIVHVDRGEGLTPYLEPSPQPLAEVPPTPVKPDLAQPAVEAAVADALRPEDDPDDEYYIGPVFRMPVVKTIQTRFIPAGRIKPLPFPDEDD